MPFQVHRETKAVQAQPHSVVVLTNASGRMRAEIWPSIGFNCLRWQVQHAGRFHDLLYVDPAWSENPVPTRSGIPILFPFPNRIRNGAFLYQGRLFQLARNDSTKKNAIHGWACRHPWRILAEDTDANSAFVTGEFRPSKDAPEIQPLWPADYRLRITIRLTDTALRIEAEVFNPDTRPLPFGLGYHPYFRLPYAGAEGEPAHPIADYQIRSPASQQWPLSETLPAGPPIPIPTALDLRQPRRLGDTILDDLFTGLPLSGPDELVDRGELHEPSTGSNLRLRSSPDFRELVLFTPPHRRAVCIEPYTCPTDAIHLADTITDVGWRELAPNKVWTGQIILDMEVRSE